MLEFIQSSYFQALLESLPHGVVIFNTNHEAYAINNYAAYMLDRPAEDCVGMPADELFRGVEMIEEFQDFIGQAANPDACQLSLDTRFLKNDGRRLHINLTVSQLVQYHKVFGIVLSIADVSHIYMLHERERMMLEERGQLQRERAEGLRRLAQAVAHQIRNPLMSMAGFARILKRKCDNGGAREFVDGIIEGGERMQDIVTAVSDFSAIRVRERNPMDMDEILCDAGEEARERVKPNGGVRLDLKTNGPGAHVDPELLREAFVEVIVNSMEFFPAEVGHDLRVTAEAKSDEKRGSCLVYITDNGAGIPREHLPFVFDPFYTTKAVGVGMGLTKAQRIAREHGGDLRLENHPNQGTRAVFRLPLA